MIYILHNLTKPIIINERVIRTVNIDPHCDKHEKEGVSKEKIVEITKSLNNRYFFPDGEEGNKNYFKHHPTYENKRYKIVWWWWKNQELDKIFIRTCYRIKYKKKI